MLRLNHFFDGNLRKEETASAFLAMALEGLPSFRRHFLATAVPREANALADEDWTAAVEQDRIDVSLRCDGVTILVENKISAGAKQVGQLLRYYLEEKTRRPDVRVIALYLGPGRVGADEVARVEASDAFRTAGIDAVRHVAWEDLVAFVPRDDGPEERVVRNGLDAIAAVIERSKARKYPAEGSRGFFRGLAMRTRDLVAEGTGHKAMHWGQDHEECYLAHVNVSVSIKFLPEGYEGSEDGPDLGDDERPNRVHFRLMFKIAGVGRKDAAVRRWWEARFGPAVGEADLGSCGVYRQEASGAFSTFGTLSGSQDEIGVAAAETMIELVAELSNRLAIAGSVMSAAPKGKPGVQPKGG